MIAAQRPTGSNARSSLTLWPVLVLATALALLGGFNFVERLWMRGPEQAGGMDVAAVARDVVSLLLVLALMALLLTRHRLPDTTQTKPEAPGLPFPLSDERWTEHHARWLIGLRWFVCLLWLVALMGSPKLWHELAWGRPTGLLMMCLVILAGGNAVVAMTLRAGMQLGRRIDLHIGLDLVVLTAMIHLSGSLDTPVAALYTLQIIVASLLLPRRTALVIIGFAALLFALLVLLEASGTLPHRGLPAFHPATGPMREHSVREWLYWSVGMVLVLGGTAFLSLAAASQRRQQREQLRSAVRVALAEREKLERGLDAAGAGLLLVDDQGAVVWSSKRVTGTLPPPVDETKPCQRCPRCAARRALAENRPISTEFSATEPGGDVRYYRATASPLPDSDNDLGSIVEVIQDVTATKALQQEVIREGKMAAVGRLAAVVGHEVGNPLASLRARLSLLERSTDPDFMRKSVPVLREQLERIQRIIQGLSGFVRPAVEEASCDIADVLQDVMDFLRLDPNARDRHVEMKLSETPLETMWVRDELVQVFLNLSLNALRAVGPGGNVTLTSARRDQMVEVAVLDDGPGVDSANVEQIFQPFFSTDKAGMGLGLGISRGIVRARGGEIRYDADRAKGACFVVTLPLAPSEDAAAE